MKMKMKMKETAFEFYQDSGIEGMKLILPGAIESKDEKSQMYLKNNLKEIKNNFPDVYDKYPKFFQDFANKEKKYIDYKILSSKVDDINFFDRYNTLYNYFSKFSVEKTSIKNKSF